MSLESIFPMVWALLSTGLWWSNKSQNCNVEKCEILGVDWDVPYAAHCPYMFTAVGESRGFCILVVPDALSLFSSNGLYTRPIPFSTEDETSWFWVAGSPRGEIC